MKFRIMVCLAILSFLPATGFVQAQVGCSDQAVGGYIGDGAGCGNGCAAGFAGNGAGCNNGCAAGCGAAMGCDSGGCATCGHYLSVFGGWTDWSNLDGNLAFNIGSGPVGTASLETQTNDGYAVGAALGRYMNFNLRSELEFAYRNNSFANATLTSGFGSFASNLDGKINAFSGMYNLYYDFGSIGSMGLQPYVGAGAGFAFINTDIRPTGIPVALTTESSTFAYQGMAGVAFQLSNNIDLFTEYRIFGLDDFKATITGPGGGSAALKFNGLNHNIFVGARLSIR